MKTWSRGEARDLLQHAGTRHDLGSRTLTQRRGAPARVRAAYRAARDARVLDELSEVPLDRVREVGAGRLRLGPLEQAGYRTVGQVRAAAPEELTAIAGVGARTAEALREAAQQIFSAVDAGLAFRLDHSPADPLATRLVRALHDHLHVKRFFETWNDRLDVDVRELARLAETGARTWRAPRRSRRGGRALGRRRRAGRSRSRRSA